MYFRPTERHMNPLTEFSAGPIYLLRGLRLIREPRLRRYVVVPLVINVVLIAVLVGLFGWQLGGWLDAWLAGLPNWLAWLETVLWWIGLLMAALVFCYLFTFLANLIASPLNGMLSAQVEQLLTGDKPESHMTLAEEMVDGVAGELRRLRFYLGRAVLLAAASLVLLFIPLANIAIPFLWFGFGAYMLAFEYLDQPMANRGMAFDAKLAYLRSRRWRHLGFGSVVTLITAIPLANLLVMPAAVAGATALYLDVTRPGSEAAAIPD